MLAVLFCARQEGVLVWVGVFRKLSLVRLLFASAEIERPGVPSPSFWFCNSYLSVWPSWKICCHQNMQGLLGHMFFQIFILSAAPDFTTPSTSEFWSIKAKNKVGSDVTNTWVHRLLIQTKQFWQIPLDSLAFWHVMLLMHTQACFVMVSHQTVLSFSETKWFSNSQQVKWWGHHGQHSICVPSTLPLLLVVETMYGCPKDEWSHFTYIAVPSLAASIHTAAWCSWWSKKWKTISFFLHFLSQCL